MYYTQDFLEDFDFKERINYADMELQTSLRGDVSYLTSASGSLGTLELENSGVFEQVYRVPNLIGCIDTRSGVSEKDLQIRNYRFEIVFSRDGVESRSGQLLKVPVDEERKYEVIGKYDSYNIPLSAFSRNTIESVSVYELPRSERNPLGYDYSGYGNSYAQSCNSFRNDYKPVAVIPLE
jgi:hypothetical protein